MTFMSGPSNGLDMPGLTDPGPMMRFRQSENVEGTEGIQIEALTAPIPG